MFSRQNHNQTLRPRVETLTSPWFTLALFFLVVNDHFLKINYPSLLTGKLSDFSGLFVFAVFIAVLLPDTYRTARVSVWLHVGVGLAFVIWKLAPVELLLSEVARCTGWPVPGRVKDTTDLMALTILPLSHLFLARIGRGHRSVIARPIWRQMAASVILLVSGWSIMATYIPLSDEAECCEGITGNVDSDERQIIDISDITFLEDYLYHSGQRPACLMEADVNGSLDRNPVNHEDLIYLVDYVFSYGPEPCRCLYP